MPDDLRALLAAIVADPADDTARLAYADCLQEHGNTPLADFIRLQIEAQRLHPDSSARARLEEKARGLFADHWIEWWGEACSAIGFSMHARKQAGAVGRLARRIGITPLPGSPYHATSHFCVHPGDAYRNHCTSGWSQATFRRGFPDTVCVTAHDIDPDRHFLKAWPTAAPLVDLAISTPYTERWIDGPHLAGLRILTLDDPDPVVLLGAMDSPHLTKLESLTVHEPDYNDPITDTNAFKRALASTRTRQLKRLGIPLWSDPAVDVVASAANLAGLESLEISLYPLVLETEMLLGAADVDAADRRIARLARSPHLAGLWELKVVGELGGVAAQAIFQHPTWIGLRKLDIPMPYWGGEFDWLDGRGDLPDLEELRLSGVSYSVAQVAAFARSPLLKRLKHFAVRGGPDRSVDSDIAHAVDPDRIETFAIGEKELQPGVAAKLQDYFGDRFRVLPSG